METTNVESLDRDMSLSQPDEILAWAWGRFGAQMLATSSFQTQSVPLLHMISIICPKLRVYFLDTGFHFPETLSFRAYLARRLGLHVIDVRYEDGHQAFRSLYGPLHASNPDLCCHLNKVKPLGRILNSHKAWVTGVRRDQTKDRAGLPIVGLTSDGMYKIAPFADWTDADVEAYLRRHGLPRHPLAANGFRSIGCHPCTRAVLRDEEERAGRWPGRSKTECGLHSGPLRGNRFADD